MPRLRTTKDHVLRLPMPWRRRIWSVNSDAVLVGHPRLVIAWYVEFGCFFLRIGWTM
jgi:hypothetical protein